jgi:hypothetical protein
MTDPTDIVRRALLALRAAARGSDFLLARMFAVVVIGAAVVPMVNHAASTVVALGGGGDASIVIVSELRTLGRGLAGLATLGRDVLVFLGLS